MMTPDAGGHRLACALLVLALHGCARRAPPTELPVRDVSARADSLLEALHRRGWFNGAVVLGRGDQELYARGFGPANAGAGAAFTPDTPADGASIAKTLAAAALFMLEAEGRLRLDDPVQRHIKEYPHARTRVRHLITHSAGLPAKEYDFFLGMLPGNQVHRTIDYVNALRERGIEPEFEPGTRFSYSSLGFDVAALIVERVTGRRWDEMLRERVFTTLGMTSTFLRPARLADWPGVRTLSYRNDGDSLVVHDIFDNEGFYGGSNLYFSARDLHRWSRSFYTRPILGQDAMARGREAMRLHDPLTGFGGRSALNLLGWYYHPRARRYHYPGSLQGFWGSVYRDEDARYSIIYLSNNSMPQWLRPLLTRALIDIVEGHPVPAITALAFIDVEPKRMAEAAGSFAVKRVGVVNLTVRNGQIFLRIDRGIEYPTFGMGQGMFYVPGLDVWFGFPSGSDLRQLT